MVGFFLNSTNSHQILLTVRSTKEVRFIVQQLLEQSRKMYRVQSQLIKMSFVIQRKTESVHIKTNELLGVSALR